MVGVFDWFREMTVAAVTARLILAMFTGGIIGLERAKKGRAAGMRTYMFVSLGAALSLILSQYDYFMLNSLWYDTSRASVHRSYPASDFLVSGRSL